MVGAVVDEMFAQLDVAGSAVADFDGFSAVVGKHEALEVVKCVVAGGGCGYCGVIWV